MDGVHERKMMKNIVNKKSRVEVVNGTEVKKDGIGRTFCFL